MANFEFNAKSTALGTITIYVGGTTSTTVLDANLLSISNLTYDFTDLETFQLGNATLTFSDFNDDIRTNLSSIINQSWIIDVDGTKYFEGLPLESSAKFTDNITDAGDATGVFSIVIGANLFDTSGSYSGLTSYDTDYYSLSDFIEQTISNNTSITTFNYLSSFVYSANSVNVYLQKSDAGANDAFIVIKKTAVHEGTGLIGILNYLGAKLCIWKNTCYIWMKNYTGDTQSITESDVLETVTYLPYQKLDDFFLTSTIRLLNGYNQYSYIVSGVNSESFQLMRSTDYSDLATRIIDGNDILPIWANHALGNWTTAYTLNSIVVDEIPEANLYDNSDYWTQFVIFYPTDTTTLTLDSADFYNDTLAGDKIRVSFDAMIYPTDASHVLNKQYNLTFQIGSGNLKVIDIKEGIDDGVNTSLNEVTRFEFEYDVDVNVGDMIISFSTTDSGFTSAESSGVSISWDGADTILAKTLITNELNVGDYVLIESAVESAFDGVYKVISFPTSNTAELDRDPYTSDTSSYNCIFRYEPIFIAISNLDVGKISKEDKLIEIFDESVQDKITPYPFSYEKNASAVEDEYINVELRYDILADTALANTNIYSTNTPTKRLDFSVDDNTINPYSTITFSEYGITDGYIQKFEFSFIDGNINLTVIK